MKTEIRKKADGMLDWIYPRRCPVCDEILDKKEPWICRMCASKIQPIREPRCRKCSRPIRSWTEEYCTDCAKDSHVYDSGFAVYPYRGPIQKSLMRFKYSGRQEYAGFYAQAMYIYGKDAVRRMRPEILIPVPVHRKKLRDRGYNQAGVFAKRLSEVLEIPVAQNLVIRRKNTVPLKGLDPAERRKNLKDAFELKRPEALKRWKRVLLVDDIYTTGSTVDAIARVLKEGGAEAVFFAAVAAGKSDG